MVLCWMWLINIVFLQLPAKKGFPVIAGDLSRKCHLCHGSCIKVTEARHKVSFLALYGYIVGATHAHCAWFTKTYGLYPFHDTLQVPTLLGVVASFCRPLPTRTQQLPTLLAQQCWELLCRFARSLTFDLTGLLPIYHIYYCLYYNGLPGIVRKHSMLTVK